MKYCSLFRLVNAFDSLSCWLVYYVSLSCIYYHICIFVCVYYVYYIYIYMYIGILAAAEALSG